MLRLLTAAALLALPAAASAADKLMEMPIRANDLNPGERFDTFVHTLGSQAEGKDIGLRKLISAGQWRRLADPAVASTVLTNWLVYDRKVYAMADGVVTACWRNAPNNTPGSQHPGRSDGRIIGGGNHVWVTHDDGSRALYAHMKPGSVPASICPHSATYLDPNSPAGPQTTVANGVRISAGQVLGRIGNSGASSVGPHLHVHVEEDGQPVGMRFKRGMTGAATMTTLDGPWTPVANGKLPAASINIWPPSIVGNYQYATADQDYQRLFDHMADSGMMPNWITCASNGQSYKSNWVPRQGDWVSRHGMTATQSAQWHATYTGQGFARTSHFVCGTRQVSVWRK